ncbi:hypothetical protein JYU19_02280, partial [bacterium AH-315-J21]|nr:hypothetical protein [bacterium AH-315-J21]
CTTTRLQRDVLAPDSSARLTITFNTEKFSGQQSRFVEIHSTDPFVSERLVEFKAIVGGRPTEVALLPTSMLMLSGQAGDSLVVKNFTSHKIPFRAAFLDSSLFELWTEFDYLPADGYTHMYLRVKDSLQAGKYYSTLTLEFQTTPAVRISMPVKLIRR